MVIFRCCGFSSFLRPSTTLCPWLQAHISKGKNQFQVSRLKWNLRPSSYPCSAKFLRNLLSTNSSFWPKWNIWNNDLDSRVGGIYHMSISESNSNLETYCKFDLWFNYTRGLKITITFTTYNCYNRRDCSATSKNCLFLSIAMQCRPIFIWFTLNISVEPLWSNHAASRSLLQKHVF